jgi:hypothetical protein
VLPSGTDTPGRRDTEKGQAIQPRRRPFGHPAPDDPSRPINTANTPSLDPDATVRDAKHRQRSAPSSKATIAFGEEFLYILVRHEAPFDRVGWKAHLWAVAAAR